MIEPIDRGGWTSSEADAHDRGRQLYDIVTKFRDDQKLYHPEVIYNFDNVIENAYEFIAELVSVVGYLGWPEEEED